MERYVIHVTKQCNMACKYCVSGDTKIMMSDFTEKEIKDINVGDVILGFDEYTSKKNTKRKIKPAKVLNKFTRNSTVSKITTDNDRYILITNNHKMLSNRGSSKYSWREAQNFKVGQFITMFLYDCPENIDETNYQYKLGYFIGAFLGDGSNKKYIDKNGYDMIKTRFAVIDDELLNRVEEYAGYFGIDFYRKLFLISEKNNIHKDALFANRISEYEKINSLVVNNLGTNETKEYLSGFLSGIYDAEGHIDKDNRVIRISNKDVKLINEITRGLDYFGIRYKIEFDKKRVSNVRILSGKSLGNLRFLKVINPAIKRKGYTNFHNRSLLNSGKITNIEVYDEEREVYNIETETGTYIANGFAVHNCYERDKTSTYTWDEIKELIDNIVEYNVEKEFDIEYLGGEPLLAFDLIKKATAYMKSLKNVKIRHYGITTNGTILNDEIVQFLKENEDVSWNASMDGNEFMNQLRVFKDTGINSHDVVMANHKRLAEEIGVNRISIHMVTHPYNIGYLSKGIDHLYINGVRNIGIGTIESTIIIGKEYTDRFIKELDIVSEKICSGEYPDLNIDVLNHLKPRSDVRHYIRDSVGKVIAETYGRSKSDITQQNEETNYNAVAVGSQIGTLIQDIREIVYMNHQNRKSR